MRLIQSCVLAFSMYSKIPMPRIEWTKENMKYALCFFPLVGAVISIVVYGIFYGLKGIHATPLFFSAVMTVIPIVITGGIHLDGLLDTTDALSSYGTKEKKIEILKDPHTGAFAIIGCVCYMIVTFGLWSEVNEEMIEVIALGFIVSRGFSGLSVVTFPLAKDTGLAATFSDGAQKKRVAITMIGYVLLGMAGMIVSNSVFGFSAIMAIVLSFFYYYCMSKRQFGGITGDLAGFFLQVTELAILVAVVIVAKLI